MKKHSAHFTIWGSTKMFAFNATLNGESKSNNP